MKKMCIGVDIGKLTFVAAIKDPNKDKPKTKSFSNNEEGFKALLEWTEAYSTETYHVCMESTGKYGDKLATFLHAQNWIVSIVNPTKIKYFGKTQLARNKTDSIDSKLILQYCELFNPAIWQPMPAEVQALQELTKRLDTLNTMLLQEQNRLENVSEIIKESITDTISYLESEIKKVEKKIKVHIAENPRFKRQEALLASIPGIGEKTLSKIIAFLAEPTRFNDAKKVAAFVGLNPQHYQSGTSLNHSHLSKTGDADLRRMLYMPTLVALRYNPIIKAFYERLVGKGKPKKVAVCAAMRKLVHMIYGVLKSDTPFDPSLA
jgi:transposase